MARRKVEVVFLAEMSAYRRGMREGREETGRFRDSTKDAQREVANLGAESQRAAEQVSRSSARFRAAGGKAGREFADGFTRDAQGRLRTADSRFAQEGERLGESLSRGVRRGARRGGPDNIFGSFASVFQGSRAMLLLAGGAAAAVGALEGIPPVLSAIGGSLAAIPSLAAGATGAIASIGLGLHGIGDAIDEVFNPKGGGGGGGFDDTAAKVRRLESAERSLARAQRDARLAQAEVNAARRQATRDLRDMTIALGRATLDERDAQLSLEEAQARLAELQSQAELGSPGVVDPLELRRAQLSVDEAKQSLVEARTAAQDLRVDQAAAAKAGVEGSEQVQAALRRQHDAQDAVIDATNSVKDAQEALARSAAGGGAAVATAYSKLSPNAKAFVDEVRRLKDELVGVQQVAQQHVFAGLDRELDRTARVALPFARREVARFGDTWNETFRQLLRLGRDPQFLIGLDAAFASSDRFFDKVNARIPVTGRLLAQLFTHATPFVDKFGDSLLSYVDDFADFVDRTARDGRLDDFFADAAEQADALLDIGRELFRLVAQIGGMRQGSTLLRDMADALKRFNDQAHDTRDLNVIIEAGNEAIKGVVNVLLTLGDTLGDTLADPSTRDAIEAFFEVLGTGAQVIHDLLAVFNALPGPVKEFVLVGAGLALVYGRLGRVFGPLGDLLGRLNTRLGETGPAGQRAADGLSRVGRAAKAAGVALLAMEGAASVLDTLSDAEVDVTRLGTALEKLGKTGQFTGELERVFGDDPAKIRKYFGAASDGIFQTTARAEEAIPVFGRLSQKFSETFHGASFTAAKENVRELDQQLADFARTTDDVSVAQAAYTRLLQSSGLSADQFAKLLPASTEALHDAWQEADRAGKAQGRAGKGMRDAGQEAEDAAKKVQELSDAYDKLFGATLSLDEAEIAYQQGLADLRKELGSGSKSLNINTQAGRENASAVLDQIDKINDLRQAQIDNGVSVRDANDTYQQQIEQLRKTLIQMGYNEDQVNDLIGRYKAIPSRVYTAAEFNTAAADRALKTIKTQIRRLDGTVVTIRVRYDQQGRAVEGGERSRGGQKVAFRWGGIVEHAQVGLLREAAIFGTRSPARYAFAEPGTGGEAFIPRYGDAERSVSIGRRAMEWYGYAVVPKAALAAAYGQAAQVRTLPMQPPSPPVVHVTVNATAPDGDRLAKELIRTVRYTVATQAGGDVQKALGGR